MLDEVSLTYTKLSAATNEDDWQKTFVKALRLTTPKERRPGVRLIGAADPMESRLRMAMAVSPTTRHELYAWRTYAFGPIVQLQDVPDDEVWCVHVDKDELDIAFRDPAAQPIGERWHRAWVIAGKPGAYGMEEVANIMGHLHHAETKRVAS